MRNELNDIEKIERYLRNEMSSDERIAFENEMQNNPDLKKSVEEQQQLLKGMERMGMKKAIAKAGFQYKFQKALINIGIPIIVTATITAILLNWSTNKQQEVTPNEVEEPNLVSYELPTLNESGDSLWSDADKFIPYQIFSFDNSKDTILEGKDGGIYAIPANAFVDENGKPIKGKIDFELKEAFDTKTILKGGLSTTSNGELLETGGMFYLNARQDGKSLKLAAGKNIIADVPSDNSKTGMLLFDGERKEDGTINWVNPKPIEKPLVPVDIHTLNFYPPNYEDSLAAITEKASIKKYKDSLYYSFAGNFKTTNLEEVEVNNNITIVNVSSPDSVKLDSDWLFGYAKYLTQMKNNGYKHIIFGTKESDREGHSLSIEYLRKHNEIIFLLHLKLPKNNNINGIKLTHNGEGKFCNDLYLLNRPHSAENNATDVYFIKNTNLKSKTGFTFSGFIKYSITSFKSGTMYQSDYKLDYSAYLDPVDLSYPVCGETLKSFSGLNPAKVKSIWNDKFQNTLIATKEFEERMPYIHRLCDRGNWALDLYINNLDKRISTIDSMVAKKLSGKQKEDFLKFASRGEGRVRLDNELMKKLGKYYDEQTKIFTQAAKIASEKYYKDNAEANVQADKKVEKYNAKDKQRESENFNREFAINLQDAYRQIGKKPNIVNGRVRLSTGTGWKNLDRYVLEATTNRETMNYTDPFTGKTAVLKYEPVEIKIKNEENYDRVLVYLLPDELNSFMRISKGGDVYREKLNMLFKHELVVLAFKGNKAYFKYLDAISSNEKYDIELIEISEKELDKQLKDLKKLNHSQEMKSELAHQFFLLQDQKRRRQFIQNEKFIRRIEKVIFPCGNYSEETAADLLEFTK